MSIWTGRETILTAPIVIMLEDARLRVEWFKSQFPLVELHWTTTVSGLFDALKSIDRERLKLIILDHDLGDVQSDDLSTENPSIIVLGPGATWPLDENGNNGMHAVDMLPRELNDVPIIVWSINSPRAQEMVARLRDKDFVAAWHPHLKSRLWQLRDAIGSQVNHE